MSSFKDEVEEVYKWLVGQENQSCKESMFFADSEKDAAWWDGYFTCASNVLDRLQAAFVRDHFREATKMVDETKEETNGE